MAKEARFFNRRALAETRGPLVVEMFLPVLSGPPPKEGLPDVPDVAIRLLDAVPVDDDAVRAVYAQAGRALDEAGVPDVGSTADRIRALTERLASAEKAASEPSAMAAAATRCRATRRPST
jgi:hypothetical protein